MANSTDLVAAEARAEREAQLRHFESLDAKAGVAIGFAGLLVTFGTGSSALSVSGRVAAILAAVIAVSAYFPRRFPTVNLEVLRDVYAHADRPFTQLFLIDTFRGFVAKGSALLEQKARRLRLALTLLSASVLLQGLATILVGR